MSANDFEIESKYHRKTVVLLLTAHILSLQDVVLFEVCLFVYFIKSAGKGFYKYFYSVSKFPWELNL